MRDASSARFVTSTLALSGHVATTALKRLFGIKPEAIPGRGNMTKTIHLLRHAQSAFNEVHVDGEPDPMLYDAPLSAHGQAQVTEARAAFKDLRFDVIIVTPLTRALQTATGIFGGHDVPMEVEALHREYLESSCDIGRHPRALSEDFPELAFDHLDAAWWYRESEDHNHIDLPVIVQEPMAKFVERVAAFRTNLLARPEERVLVVGHATFFRQFSGGKRFANCELAAVDIE
jgi:broad specificity phosphatase PhoE